MHRYHSWTTHRNFFRRTLPIDQRSGPSTRFKKVTAPRSQSKNFNNRMCAESPKLIWFKWKLNRVELIEVKLWAAIPSLRIASRWLMNWLRKPTKNSWQFIRWTGAQKQINRTPPSMISHPSFQVMMIWMSLRENSSLRIMGASRICESLQK